MRVALPFFVALPLLTFACSSASSPAAPSSASGDAGAPAKQGKTFPTAAAAPKYDGSAFKGMQVYDADGEVYLDDAALLEALDDTKLVFMGEQHETAPVQELELWLLQRMTARHKDVTLGMEHFQHDEQAVVDAYLAGDLSAADFEKKSQPWKNYAKYWKPLVDHMKAEGRPVAALNVPEEALDSLYAAFPKKPLEMMNALSSTAKYGTDIAPRPLSAWTPAYKAYFETSFDYESHGKNMGLSRPDALNYFTDLAHVRDETMAYFTSKALAAGGRVMVVAGDWHVQTGLATPERTTRYASGEPFALVTTTPAAKLKDLLAARVDGRKLARFVFVYE